MRKLIVFFLLVSCKTPEREWVSLIKNNSLDGWHIFQDNGSKTGWYVENEILIFDKISGLESGEDDSSLLSNKTYTSFEITFDWKIEEGGNSGFMWGVSDKKEYKYPYQTGPEIQIIDPSVYEKPQDVLGGEIELNNAISNYTVTAPPKRGEIWLDKRILDLLGAELGKYISLGDKEFIVSNVIVNEQIEVPVLLLSLPEQL